MIGAGWRVRLSVMGLLGLGACGPGGGGTGGGGGAGGAGGTGGGGGETTTTTSTPDECPTAEEAHVAAIVIDGTGAPLGAKAGGVSGNVTSAGLDSPPSAECGSGLAWAEIDPGDGSGSWLVCFQAPSLVWDFVPGSPAEVAQVVNEHPIAPASIHTTLRSGGALIAHAEQAYYEAELALPDGVAIARGEQVCASPEDACQIEGYSATVVVGEESAGVMAGESVTLGGYRTYVDRYFTLKTSSACDSGDADIRVAVLPAPR